MATLIAGLITLVELALFGSNPVWDQTFLRVALPSALLNALCMLPLYLAAEALRERLSQLEAKQLQGIKLTKAEKTELERLHSQIPNTASAAVEAALRRLAVKP